MSTFTTAKNLEQVARGGDVGTWDTPTNSNWGIVDAAIGQVTTISLNNSPVTLSTPQYQCNQIIFNSTLTGSVTITFPTTFTGFYSINNLCTGTSAFTITLTTSTAGQVICAPPGEIVDIFNDGTNIKFRNLGRIGSYIDYAGTSVPAWITGCTIDPYLYCNGTTFSSATYPALATILGSTTLPDMRGRQRTAYNDGTGRITAGGGGIDGNTLFATGGNNGVTLAASQIPTITSTGGITWTSSLNLAGTTGTVIASGAATGVGNVSPAATVVSSWTGIATSTGTASVTYSNSSQTGVQIAQPGIIAGITLIRAA